ncbi:hypothetical protein L9F63_010229, partial [Diploptera punctata]
MHVRIYSPHKSVSFIFSTTRYLGLPNKYGYGGARRNQRNSPVCCYRFSSTKYHLEKRRWRTIPLGNGQEVTSVEGPVFNITRVNRLHMGAYLCIASNGVPPTVSKRIMLIVHFPPMIWIQNQLVGAYEGQQMTLECHSEAYPKSINYWTREKGEIIAQGGKYEPMLLDNAYKVHMKLTIRSVSQSDFGSYKCVSKNSLGDTDGSIKLYRTSIKLENIRYDHYNVEQSVDVVCESKFNIDPSPLDIDVTLSKTGERSSLNNSWIRDPHSESQRNICHSDSIFSPEIKYDIGFSPSPIRYIT